MAERTNRQEVFDSSWIALLFAILSLAYRADEMYNKTVEAVSVELELLTWNWLTRDKFVRNATKSGLQALLLIAFINAHRGHKIASLARLSHQIYENLGLEEEREKKMLRSGVNTLISLSFQLTNPALEDWMPSLYEQKEYGAQSFSAIHFELDELSFSISQWSRGLNSQGMHNIAKRMQSLGLMLSNQGRGTQDIDQANFDILKIRLYHQWHCLMRPFLRAFEEKFNIKGVELAREQCLLYARDALRVYYVSMIQKIQPMGWYLTGLGSFYAVDCALTLAKYSKEREPMLEMIAWIFIPLASQSTLCLQKLPELTEAMMNYHCFQDDS